MFGSKLKPFYFVSKRGIYGNSRIGDREVVGHGFNGSIVYKDDAAFPFPAIRFQTAGNVEQALRMKEKCNWSKLTKEEKKSLYRLSFCQTFAEFQHPTGQWKFCLGWALFFISFGFWGMMFNHFFENMDSMIFFQYFRLMYLLVTLINIAKQHRNIRKMAYPYENYHHNL